MRTSSSRCTRVAALACCASLLAAVGACAQPAPPPIHVAKRGSDANEGTSSASPLRTIQAALDRAQPGHVIWLAPGEYKEDIDTVRSGEPKAPIRIVGKLGKDGRRPVIRGSGSSHIVDINHDFIWLEDLTIDGLVGKPSEAKGYRSKLVYVSGTLGETESPSRIGVRLLRLKLRNAGTECVRFKFGVRESEIAESLIENCGVWDFRFGRGKKNGEGIYVGTAPEQLPKDPVLATDDSRDNWIHHNWVRTNGAECVDIKEGSTGNRIEFNECSGLRDADSGGISIRGSRNVVRNNRVHDNLGAGIRLGGDTPEDCRGNDVLDNELYRNAYASFKIMSLAQGRICGNRTRGGDQTIRGPGQGKIDPLAGC